MGLLYQLSSVTRLQCRDPVQTGRLQVRMDVGGGDRATVADQCDMLNAKVLLDLSDLGLHRHRVGDVSGEHIDRNRTTLGTEKQSEHDLLFGFLPFFRPCEPFSCVVPQENIQTWAAWIFAATRRQRAVLAFQINGGHVIQNQQVVSDMAVGKRFFKLGLAFMKPVEHTN